MGADIVGWRGCRLQQREGEDGFFRKLKLVAYKREAERQVSGDRATLTLKIQITGQPEEVLTYPALMDAVGDFEAGIPECVDCPLAERRPLGCYRYVSFPIPAEIEESLAIFAEWQLERGDSSLRVLVERYLQDDQVRALSNRFRHNRGESVGHLAARPTPVALQVDSLPSIDTADLLVVMLPPFREGDELALHADVLEAWLAHRVSGGYNERHWAEWSALARIMREASELARSLPTIAVLIDA
jgi:hypothetical protein